MVRLRLSLIIVLLYIFIILVDAADQQKSFYEILGVSQSASEKEIKRKYRQLARKYHPDHNKEPGARERFQEINKAYDTLSDKQKRQAYDLGGGEGSAQGHNPFGHGGGNPFTGTHFDFNQFHSSFGPGQGRRGGGREEHTFHFSGNPFSGRKTAPRGQRSFSFDSMFSRKTSDHSTTSSGSSVTDVIFNLFGGNSQPSAKKEKLRDGPGLGEEAGSDDGSFGFDFNSPPFKEEDFQQGKVPKRPNKAEFNKWFTKKYGSGPRGQGKFDEFMGGGSPESTREDSDTGFGKFHPGKKGEKPTDSSVPPRGRKSKDESSFNQKPRGSFGKSNEDEDSTGDKGKSSHYQNKKESSNTKKHSSSQGSKRPEEAKEHKQRGDAQPKAKPNTDQKQKSTRSNSDQTQGADGPPKRNAPESDTPRLKRFDLSKFRNNCFPSPSSLVSHHRCVVIFGASSTLVSGEIAFGDLVEKHKQKFDFFFVPSHELSDAEEGVIEALEAASAASAGPSSLQSEPILKAHPLCRALVESSNRRKKLASPKDIQYAGEYCVLLVSSSAPRRSSDGSDATLKRAPTVKIASYGRGSSMDGRSDGGETMSATTLALPFIRTDAHLQTLLQAVEEGRVKWTKI